MFIKRDTQGQIIAVSRDRSEDCSEEISDASDELQSFLHPQNEALSASIEALKSSDTELIRVVEDLIDLLTDKGVIQFTDLPKAAQQKLMKRQTLRKHNHSLKLFAEDSDEEMVHLP
ncbi:tryptophan synthase subunit beta like protein [Nitrincola tapanii]|uniref:Tryptophan synthase subunit beta like protein n=1 Tax=Nitrincola tapanii TaxID=1708751 RepID=A0A5A9W3W4_9GAMM|nr:tryptophan synthase subunit beta like protein [Nitrincola tapanii]KAA0875184.1 tryptophan synthase subunit beta like protein [Nitrincola tapanii]